MHRALAVLASGLTLATLVGCTADPSEAGGILVLKNVLAGEGCVTTADEGETGISHGSLDVAFPSDYVFIAQMRSRIIAITGEESQRTIITTGARIDITFPGSSLFSEAELSDLRDQGFTHFRQLFSAPIAPNSGVTDAGFVLIPASLVAKVTPKLSVGSSVQSVATFTVEGDMSGQRVESQEFSYPVTMFAGSSVSNLGACATLDENIDVRTGNPCNPLQDGVVDCCTGAGGALVCPARKQ